MNETSSATGQSAASQRVERRTLGERRRRVWRNVLFVIAVTVVMLVLSLMNRDEQAIRGCRERLERVLQVFQKLHDSGDPPPALLPLPQEGDRVSEEVRSHMHYNVLYSERILFSREVGVCCCLQPHARLFQPSGRHVIILDTQRGKYELRWMDETEFERRAAELGLPVLEPR